MKRKLDLRTGRPVWFANSTPALPVKALKRDVRTQVLVVGMGISGAMIAQALSEAGLEVVVIDRRGALEGSTSATTALVQYEIDQPLTKLAALIGKDKAQRAWRRSRLAVLSLKANIEELAIPCNLASRPSLYLAGNVLDPEGLRQEREARREAGIHAAYLDASTLRERFGIERKGAILSYDNLVVEPRKLAAGLLLKAVGQGARLYAPSEASKFTDSRDEVTVATKDGPTIVAEHVVLATGYELTDVVPMIEHSISSTWAFATAPQTRALWPQRALIWEASDPYLYLRATASGRIICGGEDEPFSDAQERDVLIPEKTERLVEKVNALFPALDAKPVYRWAGTFGSTKTGLPVIGQVPRHPRLFAALGYGGNGIVYSRIAAELIRISLTGGSDRDADLFAFPR